MGSMISYDSGGSEKEEIMEIQTPVKNMDVWNDWVILPLEIWGEIMNFLPVANIFKLGLASKRFSMIVSKCTRRTVKVKGGLVMDLVFMNNNFYLPLKKVGADSNFGTYYLSNRRRNTYNWGGKTDVPLLTIFTMIRIDPETLKVHNSDFTFAKTTGSISHHADQIGVPLGTCFDCENPRSKMGSGRIDLRGTPFFIVNDFKHAGCSSNGEWTFTHRRQVVDLRGGGYCGWTCPVECKSEANAYLGGWYLQLGILEDHKKGGK